MSSYSVIIIISMLFAVLTNTAPQKLDTTPLITPKDGEPLGTIIGIPWVMVAYWLAAFIIFAFILLTFMYGLPKWGWWKLKGPGPKPEMIRSWRGWLTRDKYDQKQAKQRDRATNERPFTSKWTKASFNWIFWDPNGEGSKRFHATRNQSYLRCVLNYFRSRPADDTLSHLENGGVEAGSHSQTDLQYDACTLATSTSYAYTHFDEEHILMSGALQGPGPSQNLTFDSTSVLQPSHNRGDSEPIAPSHEYNAVVTVDPVWPFADENAPPMPDGPNTPVLKPYLPHSLDDIPELDDTPDLNDLPDLQRARSATDAVISPGNPQPQSSTLPLVPRTPGTSPPARKHPRLRKLRSWCLGLLRRVFKPKPRSMSRGSAPKNEPRRSRFTEGFDMSPYYEAFPIMELPTMTVEEGQHRVQLQERFESPVGTSLNAVDEREEQVHWYGGSRRADARAAYPMQGLESGDGVDLSGEAVGVLAGLASGF